MSASWDRPLRIWCEGHAPPDDCNARIEDESAKTWAIIDRTPTSRNTFAAAAIVRRWSSIIFEVATSSIDCNLIMHDISDGTAVDAFQAQCSNGEPTSRDDRTDVVFILSPYGLAVLNLVDQTIRSCRAYFFYSLHSFVQECDATYLLTRGAKLAEVMSLFMMPEGSDEMHLSVGADGFLKLIGSEEYRRSSLTIQHSSTDTSYYYDVYRIRSLSYRLTLLAAIAHGAREITDTEARRIAVLAQNKPRLIELSAGWLAFCVKRGEFARSVDGLLHSLLQGRNAPQPYGSDPFSADTTDDYQISLALYRVMGHPGTHRRVVGATDHYRHPLDFYRWEFNDVDSSISSIRYWRQRMWPPP